MDLLQSHKKKCKSINSLFNNYVYKERFKCLTSQIEQNEIQRKHQMLSTLIPLKVAVHLEEAKTELNLSTLSSVYSEIYINI